MGREQTDTDCGLYIPDIGTLYLRCNEYHEGRRYVFASRARVVVWNLTSAKVRQLVEAPSISLFPSSLLSFYRVPLYQRIIPNVAKHSPRPSLGYVLCKRNVESTDRRSPEMFRKCGSIFDRRVYRVIWCAIFFPLSFLFQRHERGCLRNYLYNYHYY